MDYWAATWGCVRAILVRAPARSLWRSLFRSSCAVLMS